MAEEACPECGQPLPAARSGDWQKSPWQGDVCSHCGCAWNEGSSQRKAALVRASDPAFLTLSPLKLRLLRPDLFGLRCWINERVGRSFPQREYLREQLRRGDSRAAVVACVGPLLVAAYTDEIDCVAMLRFSDSVRERYSLSIGARLLAVNSYKQEHEYDPDLFPGPGQRRQWTGFHPIIAEFLSDDEERIERRKREIAEEEWRRATALAESYLKLRPGLARDGRPIYSAAPALRAPR